MLRKFHDECLTLPSTYKARIRCGEEFQINLKNEYLMEHINRVELRGNVGTVRLNEHNGKKVANFSLVTELLYKSREGVPISDTTWHNIVAWSGKDIADPSLITKGSQVHVTGRIRTVKYTSADGVEKFFYEVLASKLQIVKDDSQTP